MSWGPLALAFGIILIIVGVAATLRRDPDWDGFHWPSDGTMLAGTAVVLVTWLLG